MKHALLFFLMGLGFCSAPLLVASAQVRPQDTEAPKEVSFGRTEYVVEPGATNVVLDVVFGFGNRGREPDWVDYYTQDASAEAGRDYTAVGGTLSISWTGRALLEIPIQAAAFDSTEKWFQVFLTKPDAIVWNSPATVMIRGAPRLQIARSGAGLVVAWPAAFDDYVLERAESLNSVWVEVSTPAALVAGRWQIEEPLSGFPRFYRLRR